MFEVSLNRFVRLFSLAKVPLLGLLRPQIVTYTDQVAVVRLPLNFLSKNHVGSMYFGALAMGAELSVALTVVDKMRLARARSTFIFKDFSCEFKRRADTHVDFCCLEVAKITELFERAISSGERVEGQFEGFALPAGTDPVKVGREEAFMTYRLTISIKKLS